jgi:hypothetical protein
LLGGVKGEHDLPSYYVLGGQHTQILFIMW